jgi:hypothetical protein
VRTASRRPGLALPVAIGLATTAALCVLSAFTQYDAGGAAAVDRQRRADAYALAVGGIERFAAERPGVARAGTPDTAEHATFEGPAGRVEVALTRVHAARDGQPALYLIRSRGIVAAGRAASAAEHTVTQFATWQPAGFAPRAAWTSARPSSPAYRTGISGEDRCGASAALPPVLADADLPGIDWRGIVEGTALSRRATVRPEELPRYSSAGTWPIIRVDGDHELTANGHGTLIVTGDLRIVGGHEWRGLVLAGGRVELRRGAVVRGALVTGLNDKLGLAPAADDTIDPRARVRFDSCDLARAADAFGALALVPDTRVDGWLPR